MMVTSPLLKVITSSVYLRQASHNKASRKVFRSSAIAVIRQNVLLHINFISFVLSPLKTPGQRGKEPPS